MKFWVGIRHKNLLPLALLGLVLVATPVLPLLPLLCAVAIIVSVRLFSLGVFAKAMLAVFTVSILGALILQFSSLVGLSLPFAVLNAILLMLAAVYAWYFRDRVELGTSVHDVLGLLVGVSVFLFVALPLIGATPSKMLDFLMPGEDNGSHFQMYRYVLTERKYAYANESSEAGIRPTLLSYAQGSHAAMAVVTAPFVEEKSPNAQLRAYALTAAAVFASMFWAAFLLIIRPLRQVKDSVLNLAATVPLAVLFVAAVPFGILLNLYTYGYYPQYFSYLALAVLLLIVTLLHEKGNEFDRKDFCVGVAAVALATYAVFSSWYLLVPLAVVPLAGYVWGYRKNFMKWKWFIALVLAPFVLACAHLAYVYLFTSTGAGHVLTTGGVEKMRWWVLLLCIPAAAMAVLFFVKKQIHLSCLALVVLMAGLSAALVGAYQVKKIHHFDYYFYKMLFTVVFVAVLFYGYAYMRMLADILSVKRLPAIKSSNLLLASSGVVLTIFMLLSFNLPKYLDNFMRVKYAIPQTNQNRLLDVFTHEELYAKYSDVVFINYCNPYANFTGTIWAGGYFLPYNVERQKLENSMLNESMGATSNDLVTRIKHYVVNNDKPVAIVDGECVLGFVKESFGSTPNAVLLDVNARQIVR